MRARTLLLCLCLCLCLPLPTLADVIEEIPACRLLDTRSGSPLAANTALEVDVRGECAVPEKASGIVFNLTVVSPAGSGYLKAYSSLTAPDTAVITYNSGETVVTTGALVWLSKDDENTGAYDPPSWGMKLLSLQNTHVVVDVTGYLVRNPTTYAKGTITDKSSANGPPTVTLDLDTLFPGFYVVCQEPWIDPDHCDFFDVNDDVCITGHVGDFGGLPKLFAHTMTDCL